MITKKKKENNEFTILLIIYLQKGFVEAKADDGLLEVFGFKHGWHASFVMADLISAKHIAQVFRFTKGQKSKFTMYVISHFVTFLRLQRFGLS